MLPDRVSNPGPLPYESDALPIALRGPASEEKKDEYKYPRKSHPIHVPTGNTAGLAVGKLLLPFSYR